MISGKLAETVLILFQFFRHVQHETALVFNEHAESYLTAGGFLPEHIMQQVIFYQCILCSRWFSTSAYYSAGAFLPVHIMQQVICLTLHIMQQVICLPVHIMQQVICLTLHIMQQVICLPLDIMQQVIFLAVHIMQQVLFYQCILCSRCFSNIAYYAAGN